MPKFLADGNFNGYVFRAIKRRFSHLEIIRVQDVQLVGVRDELVLEWAAPRGYVLLTHDARTMIRYGRRRVAEGLSFPGMVVFKSEFSIGRMVTELEMLIECTRQDEWEDHIGLSQCEFGGI